MWLYELLDFLNNSNRDWWTQPEENNNNKVALWLSQKHFPKLCCFSRHFPPKWVFPIKMHLWVLLQIQHVQCFHVFPGKRLLSDYVNDHPRWTASLPLRAACEGSKRAREKRTEKDTVRESSDSFPFDIAFDERRHTGGGRIECQLLKSRFSPHYTFINTHSSKRVLRHSTYCRFKTFNWTVLPIKSVIKLFSSS